MKKTYFVLLLGFGFLTSYAQIYEFQSVIDIETTPAILKENRQAEFENNDTTDESINIFCWSCKTSIISVAYMRLKSIPVLVQKDAFVKDSKKKLSL